MKAPPSSLLHPYTVALGLSMPASLPRFVSPAWGEDEFEVQNPDISQSCEWATAADEELPGNKDLQSAHCAAAYLPFEERSKALQIWIRNVAVQLPF